MIEQIADERWKTMSETVNGWRGSLTSGRCSRDWALNAANTKNQVGTEVAGLAPNPDGSLTVYLQHAKPADDRVSNWLPAPAGSFNLTMRYYTPLAPVLTKAYKLPAVTKS